MQNFKPRKKQQGPKTYEHQVEMAIRLMEKGRVSRGLRVLANKGVGDSDHPEVRQQMIDKMPAGARVLGERDYAEAVSMAGIGDVLRKLDALVGVGGRGLKAHYLQALATARSTTDEAAEAVDKLQELGEEYASGELPPWVRHMMNAGLLTPIIKSAAPPGVTPDMRPIVARETDIAVFDKVVNASVVEEVNKKLRPQQLAIGEPMGCEKKIWTMKLLHQEAKKKPGGWAIAIALDQGGRRWRSARALHTGSECGETAAQSEEVPVLHSCRDGREKAGDCGAHASMAAPDF